MRARFVRDDGYVLTLAGSYQDEVAWGITEMSGIDTIENTLGTVVPAVGDGIEVISERIPARNIDITASVKDRRRNSQERALAQAFFNPKHRFKLYVTKGSDTRWIEARIERFRCPEQPEDRHVSMNISLLCADPYFHSVDDYGRNIAAVRSCFGFPYMSRIGGGFRVGIYNFSRTVDVENTGDVETYVRITITADGFVENPKLQIGDASIRLLDVLHGGDTVEVDLVHNTIRKNGVNCIGKVDRHSSFSGMVLRPGKNVVSFGADNGDTQMKVVLYYNLRYLGV